VYDVTEIVLAAQASTGQRSYRRIKGPWCDRMTSPGDSTPAAQLGVWGFTTRQRELNARTIRYASVVQLGAAT